MSEPRIKGYIVPKEYKGSCLNFLCEDENGREYVPYTSLSLAEYLASKADEGAHVVTPEQFDALYDAHLNSLVSEPTLISSERYEDLLEAMPPCRWHNSQGVSMFHMIERLTGNLVTWCASYRGQCFEFTDYTNTPSERLAEKVKKASEEHAKG